MKKPASYVLASHVEGNHIVVSVRHDTAASFKHSVGPCASRQWRKLAMQFFPGRNLWTCDVKHGDREDEDSNFAVSRYDYSLCL